MSRSRWMLLVLGLASVFCLGDMRGDDPSTTKEKSSAKVPDRLLKAIGGKATKTAPAPTKPATDEKEAREPAPPAPEKAAAEKVDAKEAAVKAPEVKPAKLTPKQISFVKSELLPTYESGEPLGILNLVCGQLARWTDPQIAGMNQLLAELHAPTLDKMITDARMNLVRAGIADKGPEATSRETAIVLREIKRQIEEILKTAQGIDLMKDPFPKPQSMMEFRDILWEAHVQNNQLINADGLAFQGNLITQSKVISKARNATAVDKAIFATKFPEITAQIRAVHRELNERGVELRVDRIKFANKVLQESKDVKERFFAAYAVGVDGELLVQGFKENPGPFIRQNLGSVSYLETLNSDIEQGKKLAGNLVKKSELLFAGMHWWRRGRYGLGPELSGLLKSAAAQTNLAAQIPLNMPRVSPVPVDPAKNPLHQIPAFDRRHHYTWAWQTRQFQITGSSSSSSNSTIQSTSSSIPMRMTPDFWNGNSFY